MTARFAEDADALPARDECHNCGATAGLMRCSRCHSAHFCSLACHKSYWPVHRQHCRKNEFADAIEAQEPRFAAFMRKHNKLAVLRDEEVERLERCGQAVCARRSRQEEMDTMYGRMEPKPQAPAYSHQELLAVEAARQQQQAQVALLTDQERAWMALPPLPPGLGLQPSSSLRWSQDLTRVEVTVRLPPRLPTRKVSVQLAAASLHIMFGSKLYRGGLLCHWVDLQGCTWFAEGGLLHISLLKRCRRGRYWALDDVPAPTHPVLLTTSSRGAVQGQEQTLTPLLLEAGLGQKPGLQGQQQNDHDLHGQEVHQQQHHLQKQEVEEQQQQQQQCVAHGGQDRCGHGEAAAQPGTRSQSGAVSAKKAAGADVEDEEAQDVRRRQQDQRRLPSSLLKTASCAPDACHEQQQQQPQQPQQQQQQQEEEEQQQQQQQQQQEEEEGEEQQLQGAGTRGNAVGSKQELEEQQQQHEWRRGRDRGDGQQGGMAWPLPHAMQEVGSRGSVTQGGVHQGPRSLRVGTAADTYWCCLFRDDPAQLPPNPPTAYYLLPVDSDDV